jgi:hypothetical protein
LDLKKDSEECKIDKVNDKSYILATWNVSCQCSVCPHISADECKRESCSCCGPQNHGDVKISKIDIENELLDKSVPTD